MFFRKLYNFQKNLLHKCSIFGGDGLLEAYTEMYRIFLFELIRINNNPF